MPRKEVTPDSPVIEANEERVNVEVTPKGESTKLVINYTNSDGQPDSIIASKKREHGHSTKKHHILRSMTILEKSL